MGDIDISVKNFIKIRSVFAQLFSEGVYGGEIKIQPDGLEELNTVNSETIELKDGRLKGLERLRDIQKIAMVSDGKVAYQLILGIEGQTGVHYYMPARCMEMDAMTYIRQCKEVSEEARESGELKKYSNGVPKGTKVLPVVTLVFYTGKEPWDGPRNIYDMLEIPEEMKEKLRTTLPDYKMNLIDARHMSDEEIDRFDEDLNAFLHMLREKYDREKLKKLIARHRETWYAISEIKNDIRYKEYIDSVSDEELEGGVRMDVTLDYVEARGRAEGEARGRAEGEAKVNKLGILLTEAGRAAEFLKSLSDSNLQKKLFIEFGLEEKK